MKYTTCMLVCFMLLVAGCATTKEPYDYTNLIESKPRSIVVIPPLNNSIEVNASYTFLSTINAPLAEKGYYVFPVAVIDHFLKENGLPTPAEMNSVPLEKIRENIGADAVLYVSIENWGQKYQVINSKAIVDSKVRLVDTVSGKLLWETNIRAQRSSSDNNNNGLLGALVSAIADQIVGSTVDHTRELSSFANNIAINDSHGFLLDGPNKVESKK